MITRPSHLKRFKAAPLFREHIQFVHILITNQYQEKKSKHNLLYELKVPHKPDTGNPWECLKLSSEAFMMG